MTNNLNTTQATQDKLHQMSVAIETLMNRFPGRLNVNFEDDYIRIERIRGGKDADQALADQPPIERLQMDIDVDLDLLELGQANDTAMRPREGFFVVQYQLGDTPDKEHHIHFPTVEAVIDYLTINIVTPDERQAIFH